MDFNKFCLSVLFCLFIVFKCSGFQNQPAWLIPESFSENTLPASTRLFPFPSEENALKTNFTASPLYKSLNGSWRFKWYKNKELVPANFSDPTIKNLNWDQITVPSYWQMAGLSGNKSYDAPVYLKSGLAYQNYKSVINADTNATGIYQTTFDLPPTWKDHSVTLHFEGVGSACYVWLNGIKLGYHEDSKTPFAFQIDSIVKSGSNTLVVQVLKWSDGSILENHEGWKLSGIFRDVYLTKHDETQIRDVFVSTKLDENFRDATINLRTTVKNNKNYIQYGLKIKTSLYDENNKVVGVPAEKIINMLDSTSQITISHSMAVANPQKWSAEKPNLYRLIMQLSDEKNQVIEVVTQKIGFREIGYKTNQFLLNGKAITIKGVNLTTSTPVAATRESILKDIILMKENNINAVWLDGPHHPLWYDLCDEYGLYIISEPNIYATFKEGNNAAPWKQALTARAQKMWERDKNHPSIIAWSTGSYSSKDKNISSELLSFFQLADVSRPVLSRDNLANGQNYPILTSSAVTINELSSLPKDITKPILLHSFGRTTGNGLGGIFAFWQATLKSAARQGGFVENWRDNNIVLLDKNGEAVEYRNYEAGVYPRGGMISPLGSIKPQIKELKKAFEPIIITNADTVTIHTKGTIITNKFDFQSLSDFVLHWALEENGKIIQDGNISFDDIRPNQSQEIKFPFDWPPHPRPDGYYYLNLRVLSKNEGQWFKKGHEIASKQVPLKIGKVTESVSYQHAPPLRMNFLRGIGIEITGADFSVTFDKETAQLSSYVYKDKEFLESGFHGNFWRVPTSHDFNDLAVSWQENGIDSMRTASSDLRVEKLNNHIFKVSTVKRLAAKKGSIQINTIYTVYASGDIHIQYAFIPSGSLPPLPRIGLQMHMRENMNEVVWFGKGPYESYSDRKSSAFTSLYSQKIQDQHFSYYPAQETGNKSDVHWFAIKDIDNDGLIFIPDSLVNINIQNYTNKDLLQAQRTGSALKRGELVVLNMDLLHEGITFASNLSENPIQTTRRFSFRIKPVSAQTDYFSEANKKLLIVARKMSPGLNRETN